MMKRTIKSLGSVLVVICLLVALLPCAAFAVTDEYYDAIWTGTQGVYSEWGWATMDGLSIGYSCVESGLLPDGIEMGVPGSNVQPVSGTPTQSCDCYTTILVKTGQHDYHVTIHFKISAGGHSQSEMYDSDSISGKVGTAVSGWSWGTINGENIGNYYISEGSMPNGLYIPTPGSNAFQICGTPTSAGSGSFTVCVETYDVIYYVTISYTIGSNEFRITKSPSTEDANEGGNATFIAAAENYSYVEWLLIAGGNTVGTYRGECNTQYNGCTVITYNNSGKEYLVLRNIPASMSGYTIQARFTNSNGTSILTQSCTLYVESQATPAPTATPSPTPAADLKAPTITLQPTAVTQNIGSNAVLTVAASDPNGGTLNYQWYSNTAATSTGATAVSGANQSALNAPQTVGTTYYYCAVSSTKDGKTSPTVTTTPIAVTFNDPNGSTTPTASPSSSPNAEPTTTPANNNGTKEGGRMSIVAILLIVLVILAAACLVCQIIYITKRNKGQAVPMVKWDCPECGMRNKAGSHFCSECGAKNPHLKARTRE